MNLEELLRDAVAPRAGSDPAAEERVRREAMAALSGMRRRHRVRRIVSVGAAAAGVAAIGGFFAFAMPRGGDDAESAVGPVPAVAVALLNRPARPGDRLPGGIARYGVVPGAVTTIRFAGIGERLRYYAVRTDGPDRLCIIAVARSGGAPRGAVCNDPAVLRRVGVLTFERPRTQAGPGGRVLSDQAFLVPDGISTVIAAGGQWLRVRSNLVAVTTARYPDQSIILRGRGAAGVHAEGGRDWPRSHPDGVPTVGVPLSNGSVRSSGPTPLRTVRLAIPASAPSGSVIGLRVVGPDGLLGDNLIYGVDAILERRTATGWRPAYGLYLGSLEEASSPAPVVLGPDGMTVVDIGLTGGGPRPVRLPPVPPGTYRITKRVLETSGGSPVDRTVAAEIAITVAP